MIEAALSAPLKLPLHYSLLKDIETRRHEGEAKRNNAAPDWFWWVLEVIDEEELVGVVVEVPKSVHGGA